MARLSGILVVVLREGAPGAQRGGGGAGFFGGPCLRAFWVTFQPTQASNTNKQGATFFTSCLGGAPLVSVELLFAGSFLGATFACVGTLLYSASCSVRVAV